MPAFSPNHLREILRVVSAEHEHVIVGGQAINLWALRYQSAESEALSALAPFTSEDLDVLGGPDGARRIAKALGAEAQIAELGWAGPCLGMLSIPREEDGRKLRLDVLGYLPGIGTMDAIESALSYEGIGELQGLTLRVLHPLLCLEAKLENLLRFDQTARQDGKHVQIAIICVRAFLAELLQADRLRPALTAIERIGRLARSKGGRHARAVLGSSVLEAIPLDEIHRRASSVEALRNFLEIRWPQLQEIPSDDAA